MIAGTMHSVHSNRSAKRVLVIGPPPHTDGGARVSFELLLGHLQAQPGLAVSHCDLPVHSPLYRDDGGRCWATATLPDYAIRTLDTGRIVDGKRVWQAQVDLAGRR